MLLQYFYLIFDEYVDTHYRGISILLGILLNSSWALKK